MCSSGAEDYIAKTRRLTTGLSPATSDGASNVTQTSGADATVVILRSRTQRLGFLNPLHGRLSIIAVVAVLAATLLSYAIARTVTRPLGAITATMREMAATGDLTRRIAAPPDGAAWEDEDARLLATTFNTMTDSIARFQREAGQRERLSSLGRLSTVVAHEIRNPLMIIKTALRRLAIADRDVRGATRRRYRHRRRDRAAQPAGVGGAGLRQADQVRAGADRSERALRRRRASRRLGRPGHLHPARSRPGGPRRSSTDAERLRLALVNILTNARHAVAARSEAPNGQDPIRLRTRRQSPGRVAIEVRDQGTGIAGDDLSRVFDPYFTTRRTGTGLGLAISKNIVEGLGGTIGVASRQGTGRK